MGAEEVGWARCTGLGVPMSRCKGGGEGPTRSKCGERSGWPQPGGGGGVPARPWEECFVKEPQAMDQGRAGD